MTNPFQQIKDRRKPWQKKLQNLKLARCGAMLAESAAEWGRANDAAARDANRRGGRYGEKLSDREIQYWAAMTGRKVPHRANLCRTFEPEAKNWLEERGLI